MSKTPKGKSVRVVLYFSPDHPVAQIPDEYRNKMVKEMVNFAVNFQADFKELKKETLKIRKMLESGNLFLSTPESSNNTKKIETLKEIIDLDLD